MSIVNGKTGNGFCVKSIDSSKDNEFYFAGAIKTIPSSIRPNFYTDTILFASSSGVSPPMPVSGGCYGFSSANWQGNDLGLFIASSKNIFRSTDSGNTWNIITGTISDNFAKKAFCFSDSYMWIVTRNWRVYRASLTSSFALSDFKLVDLYRTGSADDGFGIFSADAIYAYSDSEVYVGGTYLSGTAPNGSFLIRSCLNSSDPIPDFSVAVRGFEFNALFTGSNNVVNWIMKTEKFSLDPIDGVGLFCSVSVDDQYCQIMYSASNDTEIYSNPSSFPQFDNDVIEVKYIDDTNTLQTYRKIVSQVNDSGRNYCVVYNGFGYNGLPYLGFAEDSFSGSVYGNHLGGESFNKIIYDYDVGEFVVAGITSNGNQNNNYSSIVLRKNDNNWASWYTFYESPPFEATSSRRIGGPVGFIKYNSDYYIAYGCGSSSSLNEPTLVIKKIFKDDSMILSCSTTSDISTGSFKVEKQFSTNTEDELNNFSYNNSVNDLLFRTITGLGDRKVFPTNIEFKIVPYNVFFNKDNLFVGILDTENYSGYLNMIDYGSYSNIGNGIYQFYGSFPQAVTLPLDSSFPVIKLSCSVGIYKIYDFKLNYEQPLSHVGVSNFRKIDNQNIKFNYLKSNILDKNNEQHFNNISEFPHSMGLFQMKNIVLGTQEYGKVGKSDDYMIQVNHIGSVVKVLWPLQEQTENDYISGYGDFSAGQRPGKLSKDFVAGDMFNISDNNYHHLSLYCYLKKYDIGTYDEIVIKVERKPLTSIPFTTEQGISYQSSGSYATEGVLTDLVYKKAVDYSDLSIGEIGFPIDIPLQNTKEIRVSCRLKNGQASEQNKNFIVYGRFIKKDET